MRWWYRLNHSSNTSKVPMWTKIDEENLIRRIQRLMKLKVDKGIRE